MNEKPLSETILEYYGGLGEVTLTQDDVDNLIKDIQKIEAERDQLKEQCNTCQMHNPTLQVRKQRLTIANLEAEVQRLKWEDIISQDTLSAYRSSFDVMSKELGDSTARLAKAQAELKEQCPDIEKCQDLPSCPSCDGCERFQIWEALSR